MKNKCSLVLAGLMLSACLCGSAYAQNIAVVDVPAVVAKSAQVQALKKEQETKVKELEKWLQTAKADVEKQQTEAGKEKLLKKYNDDFAKKQYIFPFELQSVMNDYFSIL